MNLTKRKKVILQSFMAIALLFIAMSMNTILAHATNVIVTFEAQDDGIIKYCENGEWKSDKYGFVSYDNNWFLVANGVLAVDVNGLAQDPNSLNDWYYLAGGMVQIQYTGLAEYDGAWFYVNGGKLDTTVNDCISYDGGLFYVASGRIVKEKNGLGQDPDSTEWYYFAGGQAQLQYCGLAEYDGKWFYIENGIFNKSYTGYTIYNDVSFWVENGEMIRQEVDIYANNYPKVDMFSDSYNIKGLQGAKKENKDKFGGIEHSLTNIYLDDAIFSPDSDYAKNGWVYKYEFEGEYFYFTNYPAGMQMVPNCNEAEISISAVFLLKWNDGSKDSYNNNTNFLIDEASRVPGYSLYAPNADLSTYGGRAIRAYWHYLMEWLEENGYHIDNFILGNEVNMPNQWHYSGTTDVNTVATKYADAFYYMYEAVRKYTPISRCSISIDHSWNHNDEGRGIGAREFLHVFHNRLSQYSDSVDWCVSAHLYPALLYDTRIWNHPYGLTTNSSYTKMVDGTNLSSMTNYIKDVFGIQHRVMLTEQGFTNYCGEAEQAACLAYTYYAALYDPMVDSFMIHNQNVGDRLNFLIDGSLAEKVYTKIGNGNEEDQKWIAEVCLPVIGVSSWEQIIPNYGK